MKAKALIAALLTGTALASPVLAQTRGVGGGGGGGATISGTNLTLPTFRNNLGAAAGGGVNVTKDVSPACVGDGTTDNQACFTAAFALAKTLGIPIYVPAASGCYMTSPVVIPQQTVSATVPQPEIRIFGDGLGSCIRLFAHADADMIASQNFYQYVHRHTTATAALGANAIVVDDITGVSNGDRLGLIDDTGTLENFNVGSITPGSGTTGTLTFSSGTLAAQMSTNDPWYDASTLGPTRVIIEDLYLDGNVANQDPPSNIAAAQTLGSAGNLTLRSSTVTWTPWANDYVYIYSAGNDSARTFTVTGTRRNQDGTSSAQSQAITGGNASWVMTTKGFETVTQIAVDGATASTVQAGVTENTGNTLSLLANFNLVRNVVFQNTWGWGYRQSLLPGGPAANGYGQGDPRSEHINCAYSYGGCFYFSSATDGTAYRPVANYVYGDGVRVGRWGYGTKFIAGHVSGGLGAPTQVSHGPGGTTIEPLYGWKFDAYSVECDACTAEEAQLANVLIRSSDTTWIGGQVFDADNSANSRVGFQIGDSANGWTGMQYYNIDTECKQLTAGCVNFNSDGGYGKIHLRGYEQAPYTPGPAYAGSPKTGAGQSSIDTSEIIGATNILVQDSDSLISANPAVPFTPVLKFGGGTTGIAYSVQAGSCQETHKTVACDVHIALTNKGSSTGTATITGFPAAAKNTAGFLVQFQNLGVAGMTGYMQTSATVTLNNGASALTDTSFANTSEFYGSITYIAN